jgi:hypothetical protein
MSDALATTPEDLEAIEKAVMYADFSDLSQDQRLFYMKNLCADLKLDIRRSPFQWIVLGNKLVPYAKKACTDQLRDIHKVSVQIIEQKIINGVYTVQVRATKPDGRSDEDVGASAADGLVGDALGNSIKRAVTQAKRRVTLSICGLGMLDETEVAQIPGAKAPVESGPKRVIPPPIKATLPTMPKPIEAEAYKELQRKAVEAANAATEILDAASDDVQTISPPDAVPVATASTVPLGTVKPAKLPPSAPPMRVRAGIPKAKE